MAEPIRVLQCMGLMNRGGAENLVMNLYRNINRNRVQFDFVVHRSQKSAFDDEILDLGGRIFKVPRYLVFNHLKYNKAWHDLFINHKNGWAIIHGHMFTTAAIYLKIAKEYGLVTIAHSHSVSSGSGFSAKIKDILQYPIRFNKDYYFACSRAAGEWLFGNKACTSSNFFILPNAIDVDKFEYDEEKRSIKRKEFKIENSFVIGHVGRFESFKNHTFLVDIFKEVHDKNPNTALILIGDGPLCEAIKKKVNILGLSEKVIFTGVRSDIPDLLQAMDLFLFPSLFEGLPVTLIEAQAAGLPCLISDTITKEVEVTDLIEWESLKSPTNRWADKILKYAYGYKRIDVSEQIRSSGFDVKDTARWLELFYLDKFKKLTLK